MSPNRVPPRRRERGVKASSEAGPDEEAAVLTIVGTPIGNLDDLSPRAAAALRAADLVACEDTRRTAVLLRHIGVATPMVALHAHNEASRAADLCARMSAGAAGALVTDAGMPVVSDPGARLVRAAAGEGIVVNVVPGPSAVTAAIALSGLGEGDGFVFLGFLPRRAAERAALIARIARLDVPAVAFESPNRLPAFLGALARDLPTRPVAVCRELTKVHEEAVRGTAAELAERFAEPPRGEITIVIGAGAAAEGGVDPAALHRGIEVMIDGGLGAGRAAEAVAALGVAPRNRAYEVALELMARRRAAT
jgi:16S rRNA (cytidine1402-2'-O)-methyltransferase